MMGQMKTQLPTTKPKGFGSPEFFLLATIASFLIGYFLNYNGTRGMYVGAALGSIGILRNSLRWSELPVRGKASSIALLIVYFVFGYLMMPGL